MYIFHNDEAVTRWNGCIWLGLRICIIYVPLLHSVLNSHQVDFSFSVKPLEAFNPDTSNLEKFVSTQNHNKRIYKYCSFFFLRWKNQEIINSSSRKIILSYKRTEIKKIGSFVS